MNKGLLIQGVEESGLRSVVEELTPSQSAAIWQRLERSFAKRAPQSTSTWDRFDKPTMTWSGVEECCAAAMDAANIQSDHVYVLEEAWRESAVLRVPKSALENLVSNAWYPSDDIYVCDEGMNWCLVFTSYDTIHLYTTSQS